MLIKYSFSHFDISIDPFFFNLELSYLSFLFLSRFYALHSFPIPGYHKLPTLPSPSKHDPHLILYRTQQRAILIARPLLRDDPRPYHIARVETLEQIQILQIIGTHILLKNNALERSFQGLVTQGQDLCFDEVLFQAGDAGVD